MPTCSVYGCKTGYRKGPQEYTCYSFPKIPYYSNIWKNKIDRENFEVTQHSRVCARHFTDDSFSLLDSRGKPRKIKKLHENAIPSLHLYGKNEPTKEISAKRPRLADHCYSGNRSSTENCAPSSSKQVCMSDVSFETENIQGEVTVDHEQDSLDTITKRHIKFLEEKVKQLEQENLLLKAKVSGLERVFNEDQIGRFVCPGSKKAYLPKTLQESVHLYYSCGSSAYQFLREKGYPLPSIRTLQQHLVGLNCQPGIQYDFIKIMAKKVDKLTDYEKYCGLAIDEMAILPMIQFDATTQSYKGHPTIPAGKKLVEKRRREKAKNIERGIETDDEEYAYHALNVLLCGQTIRYKQLVGYHFTDNSYDEDVFAEWLRSLIKEVKDTLGLKICSITTDMGPGNLAM